MTLILCRESGMEVTSKTSNLKLQTACRKNARMWYDPHTFIMQKNPVKIRRTLNFTHSF